jgi:hypothetical protein
MLAYVFWHSPRPEVRPRDYEAAMAAFQQSLRASAPPGFARAAVYRLLGVPWLPASGPVYEDWYVLANSAALDGLNEAAVSGSCEAPHRHAAALAANGTAGLYRVRFGRSTFPTDLTAIWLSKPPGRSYDDFYRAMRDRVRPGCALWGRQMTLGPAPEFCVHVPRGTPLLPGERTISMHRTWPTEPDGDA